MGGGFCPGSGSRGLAAAAAGDPETWGDGLVATGLADIAGVAEAGKPATTAGAEAVANGCGVDVADPGCPLGQPVSKAPRAAREIIVGMGGLFLMAVLLDLIDQRIRTWSIASWREEQV